MRRPGNANRRAGSMFVEFALGSGVMLAVFTGTFQFGYTFYQYNTLATAVNDGAHFASLIPYDSTSVTPSSAFSSSVKNMVVYGNPNGGTAPIVPYLTTSNVTLTVAFSNSVPATVTVTVNNYSINSVFGTMNCTGKPTVTYPYTGIYAPY